MRRDMTVMAVGVSPLAVMSALALGFTTGTARGWVVAAALFVALYVVGGAQMQVMRLIARRVYARTGQVMLAPVNPTHRDIELGVVRFRLAVGFDTLDAAVFFSSLDGETQSVICVAPSATEIALDQVITTEGYVRTTLTTEEDGRKFSVEVADIRDYMTRERFHQYRTQLRQPLTKENA